MAKSRATMHGREKMMNWVQNAATAIGITFVTGVGVYLAIRFLYMALGG
jgi:succinate dehydrogenase hydrophobic anchor subunit